jgi:hypothetical protein
MNEITRHAKFCGRMVKFNGGKAGLYILIGILLLFSLSVVVVRQSRGSPEDALRKNSQLRVEVLNGCGIERLALKVTDILREQGFNVVRIGNTGGEVHQETIVIERSSEAMEHAQYFSRRIGCANTGKDVDPALYVDITLILGQDYQKLFPDVAKKF